MQRQGSEGSSGGSSGKRRLQRSGSGEGGSRRSEGGGDGNNGSERMFLPERVTRYNLAHAGSITGAKCLLLQ
jgi:hypothetical protein